MATYIENVPLLNTFVRQPEGLNSTLWNYRDHISGAAGIATGAATALAGMFTGGASLGLVGTTSALAFSGVSSMISQVAPSLDWDKIVWAGGATALGAGIYNTWKGAKNEEAERISGVPGVPRGKRARIEEEEDDREEIHLKLAEGFDRAAGHVKTFNKYHETLKKRDDAEIAMMRKFSTKKHKDEIEARDESKRVLDKERLIKEEEDTPQSQREMELRMLEDENERLKLKDKKLKKSLGMLKQLA